MSGGVGCEGSSCGIAGEVKVIKTQAVESLQVRKVDGTGGVINGELEGGVVDVEVGRGGDIFIRNKLPKLVVL